VEEKRLGTTAVVRWAIDVNEPARRDPYPKIRNCFWRRDKLSEAQIFFLFLALPMGMFSFWQQFVAFVLCTVCCFFDTHECTFSD